MTRTVRVQPISIDEMIDMRLVASRADVEARLVENLRRYACGQRLLILPDSFEISWTQSDAILGYPRGTTMICRVGARCVDVA